MSVRVFLSYRRSDSRDAAGRIYDRLVAAFGKERVFFDVDTIDVGVDFELAIRSAIEGVDAVLVVIGPHFDVDRLAQGNDYVRLELAEAFRQHKLIVPILLNDTRMPTANELPTQLKRLPYRNAARARPDPDFHRDITLVIETLKRSVESLQMGGPRAESAEASPSVSQSDRADIAESARRQRVWQPFKRAPAKRAAPSGGETSGPNSRPSTTEPMSWSAVQDEAKRLGQAKQWASLWRLILSLPMPQAVQATRHLMLRKWQPRGEPDAELAALLADADHRLVSRVADSVLHASTHTLQKATYVLAPAAFSHRQPVAALNLSGDDLSTSQIVTVDRHGIRTKLYEGPASHWSLCCIDAGTVIARREFGSGFRGDTEVVRYAAGAEDVLASGAGLLDAQVEATADGFVLGLKLSPVAVALFDGKQGKLDLAPHGLHRSDLFAVDSTGTRIAFGDGERILVTDSRLQPLHEWQPLHHLAAAQLHRGDISALAFTTDSIITAGHEGGLHRWMIIGGQIRSIETPLSRTPRAIFRLSPVPAWNLVMGEAGNENFFFNASTLERIEAPQFLGGGNRVIGRFAASAHGKLAVYEGHLFPTKAPEASVWSSTVVHDLEHPLNFLAKPITSWTPADAEVLRNRVTATSDYSPYTLSEAQRDVLGLVLKAAELRPALETG